MYQTTIIQKILTWFLFIGLFVSDVLLIDVNKIILGLAVVGSFSGGIMLEYFQPSRKWTDFVKRVLASSMASMFVGWYLMDAYHIEKLSSIGLLFFSLGLGILVGLRSVFMFWKNNAKDILTTVIQTKLNIKEKGKAEIVRTKTEVITEKKSETPKVLDE